MSDKKVQLSTFIANIMAQYQAMKQSIQPQIQYRLIDIKKNEDDHYKLSVQLVGKACVVEFSPEEILTNDHLVESFSSKDIRAITFCACQTINAPKSKIISKKMSSQLNKIMFHVQHKKSNQLLEVSPSEISLNHELINSLSPCDAHTVGYMTSQEMIFSEKELINNARSINRKDTKEED